MKKLWFVSIFVFISVNTFPQSTKDKNQHHRVISNYSFEKGEKLKYLAYYGWVDAAEATLELQENLYSINGRPCYRAILKGRTIGMLDWAYSLRDTYESYIDQEALAPQKSIRDIKEGGYRYFDEVTYDHLNEKLFSKRNGENKSVKYIQDVVSAFYFARCAIFENLSEGDTIFIETYFADENLKVVAKYLGKETIETDLGGFRCLKLMPLVEKGRIFEAQDGVIAYISDDNNFIPIRVESDLWLGSFKFDLIEYSGLRNKMAIVER